MVPACVAIRDRRQGAVRIQVADMIARMVAGLVTDLKRGSRGSTSPRIRLLYVTTVSPTVRHFLSPYAAHFRALGWRVDAAANGTMGDAVLLEAFDRVHELPLSRSPFDLNGLTRGIGAITRVLGSGYDIVHVHTPIASFITRLTVRMLPPDVRPMVAYTAHGFHFHRGGHPVTNAVFLTAERLAGRWTDRLVVINDEDYEAARHHRIVSPQHLVRMPGIGINTDLYARSSVEPDAFNRARQEVGVGTETPLFVAVGEMNRNKRPSDAVGALALMRHADAHLVFVGDGPERARVETLAELNGVRHRVWLPGFVEDVLPLVGSATALIMPSKREGLARSIMEALALEVPVIASTARGNRELVDADGFVVPTGDLHALAMNMDWLIDHPADRRAMGRRGRSRMVERYDLRNLTRLHEELYRGMLEGG